MNTSLLTTRHLTVITLGYMLLPSALFLLTWIRSSIGLISLGAMLAALVVAVTRLNPGRETGREKIPLTVIGSSMGVSLLLCCISEFGLFAYKSYDYIVHNYKFHLLVTQELPLYDAKYDIDMCYYLGFYMVPALLAKIAGVQYTAVIAFFWVWIGLACCFIWLQLKMKLSEKGIVEQGIWLLLLLGGAYVSTLLPALKWLTGDESIYYNSIVLHNRFMLNQIPPFTRGLSEATQHTLPALLAFAFVLVVSGWKHGLFAVTLMLFATTYWSPFVTIGLMCFVIVVGVKALSKGDEKLIRVIMYGLGLLLAFYPVLLFLGSSQATTMASNRFIWEAGSGYWFFYYLLYAFSAYGVWFLLLRKKIWELDREALGISIAVLLALAFVQIGFYNDLNIRTATGMQLVLGVSVVYALAKHRTRFPRSKQYVFALLFFAANSLSVFKFYYERLFLFEEKGRNTIENPAVAGYENNLYDVLENAFTQNGKEAIRQYSLRKDSFFKHYLLKPR